MPVSHRRGVSLLSAAFLLIAATAVRADDWSVTTADFRSRAMILQSIGPDGVHASESTNGPGKTISMDEFVSARHATAIPTAVPKFTLALVGGDRLTGNLTGVKNESLHWDSPVLGSIDIPLDHLVALGRWPGLTYPDKSPDQDQVFLSNGDQVNGAFTDFSGGKIKMSVNDQSVDLALVDVVRITFAAQPPPKEPAGKYRVRFADRSVLSVADLSLDGDKFSLTIGSKPSKTVNVATKDVSAIEQVNGPVQWVSSLVPTESIQIPFIGGAPSFPNRFDSAVDGSPMSFDGKTTDHGIGVHAYSKLTFTVDPRWKYFRTQFAIDSRRDNPRNRADVTVRIKLDDKVLLEKAHVRVGPTDPATVIELNDAKTITLECDYGPFQDTQAHLDWIEPAFTLVKPAAPVETTTAPTTMPTTRPG